MKKRFILLILILAAVCAAFLLKNRTESWRILLLEGVECLDWIDEQLIHVDGKSRRGVKLEDLNNIVIHYVGNPGTTAQQNRNYFDSPSSEVRSHFIVGLDGEIIQCIPLTEKSSASNQRNRDTISIEICHPDETGKFTEASYRALVKLTAWLCKTCHLNSADVIRHYDITGKQCPKYYVDYPDEWQAFLKDVRSAMDT